MDPLASLFGDDAAVLGDRQFQTLLLANVLPPTGVALLSPILESLIAPLETSPADVGLLISAFTAPAVVMIPAAGVVSDRYGRKPVLTGALVLYGAAGTAIALASEFRVVLALRLLQGVAFGGITPVIITSIGDVYEGTSEATAQGLRFTGSGLTQATVPLLAGVLVSVSWRAPFLLYAAAFPVALAVALWFEEPADAPPVESGDGGSQVRRLLELVAQRRVLAVVLARGLPLAVWIGFVTYNSIVVAEVLDGTASQAGLLVGLGSLAYATSASQAGRITTAFESRYYPLIVANVVLGAGFVAFLFAPGFPVAGVAVAVAGAGFGVSLALIRSVVTGLGPEALRGSLVSLAEAFGRVVATATPVFMGAVVAYATPRVGLEAAVQAAGLGAAAVGVAGSVLAVVVATAAPAVR